MLTRGEKVCLFFTTYLVYPEGEHVGKPFKLEEFQRNFLLSIYDNPHGTHTAILSLGRKNGKTTLAAGILLAHLVGPEACQNSQILSGAQSRDQSAIIFDLASKMCAMSPKLSSLVRVQPSGKRLIGLKKNVTYRALSAEAKTAHGLSGKLIFIDELAQVVGPTDKFVEALTTSQGAYSESLLITISTQAPTANDMLSTWIDNQTNAPDPRVVCHVYAAPEDCALDDREAWKAANPGLGIFRSVADVERQIKQAMDMPANEPAVRNLILNQRVEADSPFVPRSVWEANGESPGDKPVGKVWAGLDLSAVADLTAFVVVDSLGGVFPTFWLPHEGLKEKSRKEKVPYDLWEREGLLLTTPGKAIEYEHVAGFLRTFFDENDVQAVGFDRFLYNFLKPWLEKKGFSEAELEKFIPFGQGTVSQTPALRELEVKLCNHSLKHGNHPVLSMCCANAKVVGTTDCRKFDKKKQRGRIDGMSALANAIGVMPTIPEDLTSIYDTQGVYIG